jgi:hypothetical protein
VQRDDALVVRRRLRHEVDDDPGFLAAVDPHDAADSLLVDALARRRRQVHAHRRAGRVPPLGEQHRVDQHVDLAALVCGEDLRELDRRRSAADRLRLDADGAELLGEVVRVVDAGRIDDAGRRVEPVAVEARGGLVERLVVECLRKRALLEVAADDRHRVDRGCGRDSQAAKRRDQTAARGVAERQVVDGGREDVGDLLRDQLLRRCHPDVDRLGEAADGGARLLAERRMRLVANHELVRLGIELLPVASEPGVGLDRQRALRARRPAFHRVGDPCAVPLGRQVAVELRNEQAPVGQDEDAERPRRLDEPGSGDRLAGRGRMAEAEPPDGAGVLLGRQWLRQLDPAVLGGRCGEIVLLFLDLGVGAVVGNVAVAVAELDVLAVLRGRDQLRQHSGERVDLVPAQLRPGREARWAVGEHALEPEHQRVAALPLVGGARVARVQLGDRVVERAPARRVGRERDGRVFVRSKERLTCPFTGAGGGFLEPRHLRR